MLQCAAKCVNAFENVLTSQFSFCSVLQCVAVCYSVLQCVAVCCSVLQSVAVCCSVLQCVAARHIVFALCFICYHSSFIILDASRIHNDAVCCIVL